MIKTGDSVYQVHQLLRSDTDSVNIELVPLGLEIDLQRKKSKVRLAFPASIADPSLPLYHPDPGGGSQDKS